MKRYQMEHVGTFEEHNTLTKKLLCLFSLYKRFFTNPFHLLEACSLLIRRVWSCCMVTALHLRPPDHLYENMPRPHFSYGSANKLFNHPGLNLMRKRAHRTPNWHITQHARLIGHPLEDCCFSSGDAINITFSLPMKPCDKEILFLEV